MACLHLSGQSILQLDTPIRTGPELFEAYLSSRETVGMLNPPLQMPEEERNALLTDRRGGNLMSRVWGWWLRQPNWFMAHGRDAEQLDERLRHRIWKKGDLRQLVIWEHPGKRMVYASLVDVETGSSEIIARHPAPEWILQENQSIETIRQREIGNRRVVWKINSPYLPPPPPEPALRNGPQMMNMSAPVPLMVSWNPHPPDVSVTLDGTITQGPFTLWHLPTGDLRDSGGLPGDWEPLHWQKTLPVSPWLTTLDLSNVANPFFLRATTGVLDSDTDSLDDGYELWMFGDMQQTGASDYDGDQVSNADEYSVETDPTQNMDADGNTLPDDWEVFWRDQFAVFPNPVSTSLTHRQTTDTPLILNNPVTPDADFTVTVSNNLAGSQVVYDYEDSQTGGAVYTWTDISSTGTVLIDISEHDNAAQEVMFTQFSFPFYGTTHDRMYVSSNGLITFASPSTDSGNDPIPEDRTPNNFIALFWDDLDQNDSLSGDGGSVFVQEFADKVIVQYQNVMRDSDSGTATQSNTFQAVLHASGLIYVHYKDMGGSTNSATLGIEDAAGTNGIQVLYNGYQTIHPTFAITNELALSYTPQSAKFVQVSPATGTTPEIDTTVLNVTFNTFDLPPGIYSANIDIAHTGTGTTPWDIPAVLEVTNPPSVISITHPQNGFTMWSDENMGINVSATDNDFGIERVEFYYADTKFAEDSTPSYSYNWTEPVIGTNQLTARAVDQYGAVTVSPPITVTVLADSDLDRMEDGWEQTWFGGTQEVPLDDYDEDGASNLHEYEAGTDPTSTSDTPPNIPSVVTFTEPLDGFSMFQGDNIPLRATVSDSDFGVDVVEFLADGVVVETDTSVSLFASRTWTDAPSGTHVLTARATDRYGAESTSNPITITVLSDTDFDRMPDDWEMTHFGSLIEPASADFDGDGMPNVFEYNHESDPTDPQSKLEFSETQTGEYTYYLVDKTLASETDAKKKTISAAITSANDFDVIEIKPGTYTEIPGALHDRLYIFSSEGARTTTIAVQDLNDRALYLRSESVFSGITFDGTNPDSPSSDRRAVYISIIGNQIKPRFIGCRFTGNRVADSGGAVYVAHGDPTFISCTITGNVGGNGSALYAQTGNDITLINTLLWNPGPSGELAGFPSSIIFDHSLTRDDTTGHVLIDGVDWGVSTPGIAWDGSLIANSVARDAGTLSQYADPDMDGEPLTDGLKDIGADEFKDTDSDGLPDWLEALGVTDPAADHDGDGLQNLTEYETVFTNPKSNDTDGDSLEDDVELSLGTHPNQPDSDFDGLPDGWEVQYGLDPTAANSPGTDTDEDALTDQEEFDAGSNPSALDTDEDGIPDGLEGSLIYRTSIGGWGYYDLLNPDTDNDGILDGDEDDDRDGLTIIEELALSTDPNLADTDGDGANDGDEIAMGTDPLIPQDFATLDTDGDGLTDLFELAYGTDPFDEDTNDNGMNDGEELDSGGDPQEPGDPPGPPPPPGSPPGPDPDPAPPAPITPASYRLLVDVVSHSQQKFGFAPYEEVNPTTRYLEQFSTQQFSGGCPESGPLDGSGSKTMTIDPLTGDSQTTGDAFVSTAGDADSPVRKSGSGTLSSYDDPPNSKGDCTGTIQYSSVLSDEYTTDALLANAASEMPTYTDTFGEGTPFAYRNLHANELRYDYQKVQFKFEWEQDVAEEARYEIRYWILYRPEDDPETEEVDESSMVEVVGDPIVWDGQADESPVFEIDPDVLKPGKDGRFELFTSAMVPDWNRDKVIDSSDEHLADPTTPYRFWINDDDDDSDISDSDDDLPGQSSGNSANGQVDGRNDLQDFFPVWLDIHETLHLMPLANGFEYKLSHEESGVRFMYTDLSRDQSGQYLIMDSSSYGESFQEEAHQAATVQITSSGVTLTEEFLDKITADASKGVLLLEGVHSSTAPLILEVWNETEMLIEVELNLQLSAVEDMYRWINLRPAANGTVTRGTDLDEPPNRPDDETNGEHFIFVHGYGVHEEAGRAWSAEMFKRLHQTGANTMFTAVTWYGNESQVDEWVPIAGGKTPDYYVNVENAFATAEALANIVGFHLQGRRVIAGHSLGNMVVSSAIRDHGLNVDAYLMFNAAVAMEAYDATAIDRINMRNKNWRVYTNTNLWASEYHTLFPQADSRSNLTWRNRFGKINHARNFYSSTEDVLANGTDELPWIGRVQAWVNQEMRKGTTLIWLGPGNAQGGWGFNSWYAQLDVNQANALSVAQLLERPFFGSFDDPDLHGPLGSDLLLDGNASLKDSAVFHQLLADAIPSLSHPVGSNPVENNTFGGNEDLHSKKTGTFQMEGWPREQNEWRHSDIKNIAYPYLYEAFENLVETGDLK
jgi:hypothetical protein